MKSVYSNIDQYSTMGVSYTLVVVDIRAGVISFVGSDEDVSRAQPFLDT